MSDDRKVELLAPAGNIEGFYGAIHAGADAVYLAGNKFGARAYADNFTTDEILHCIRYAHILGKKVYLTVNTLIKESEFAELYEYLAPFYENGLDAVIIQDIGVFHYIKNNFPGLALHVSTQMTITGAYGAKLLKDMGAERIVPARELSLSEIKYMKQETGLELECFIHGAMCYCYSGQCLFSSILGGRSGNRGRCAQPCRLPYSVESEKGCTKECYPLSLKDMCTIEHISELIESGIDSFKIEGRMKKPEYAAGVTAIYRKYIDEYYAKKEKVKPSKSDMNTLNSLYIRSERETGYYYRRNGKEMVSLHNPAYSGCDEELLSQIRLSYIENGPKIPLEMKAVFKCMQPAELTVMADGVSCTITGTMMEEAQKQPVTEENIKKQLNKLGDSCFTADKLHITLDDNIFIPLKAINELRREAIHALEDSIILKNGLVSKRELQSTENNGNTLNTHMITDNIKHIGNHMHVSVQTMEQIEAISKCKKENPLFSIHRIYINCDLLLNADNINRIKAMSEWMDSVCEFIISLPYILRKSDYDFLKKIVTIATEYEWLFQGFLVKSMEGMGFLLEHKYSGKLYTDAGFYIWNRESIKIFEATVSGYCLPYELRERETRLLTTASKVPFEKIIYGRIPMMITANCVAKTNGWEHCGKDENSNGKYFLIDRYKKKFPVLTICSHCINIIYNSVPLSLHSSFLKSDKNIDFRIDFTLETYQEVCDILRFFNTLYCGQIESGEIKPPYSEYTTGHEKRGVE